MLSYEVYKVIHIAMIFLFLSQVAVTLLGNVNDLKGKIITGVSSLLILVAGMGLIARLNIGHGEPWPMWIKVKLGLWVFVSAFGPIAAKRFGNKKAAAFYIIFAVAVFAAYAAVNKPW